MDERIVRDDVGGDPSDGPHRSVHFHGLTRMRRTTDDGIVQTSATVRNGGKGIVDKCIRIVVVANRIVIDKVVGRIETIENVDGLVPIQLVRSGTGLGLRLSQPNLDDQLIRSKRGTDFVSFHSTPNGIE